MQKRVAIARAIVMNPKYLFCDEPNSGLDPKTSLVIDELLSGITKDYNMTTIINTHDMNSVMGIGENICFIYQGHKEWQGNKDEVMTSTNEKLNDLVFASDLFRKVKEYLYVHLAAAQQTFWHSSAIDPDSHLATDKVDCNHLQTPYTCPLKANHNIPWLQYRQDSQDQISPPYRKKKTIPS